MLLSMIVEVLRGLPALAVWGLAGVVNLGVWAIRATGGWVDLYHLLGLCSSHLSYEIVNDAILFE